MLFDITFPIFNAHLTEVFQNFLHDEEAVAAFTQAQEGIVVFAHSQPDVVLLRLTPLLQSFLKRLSTSRSGRSGNTAIPTLLATLARCVEAYVSRSSDGPQPRLDSQMVDATFNALLEGYRLQDPSWSESLQTCVRLMSKRHFDWILVSTQALLDKGRAASGDEEIDCSTLFFLTHSAPSAEQLQALLSIIGPASSLLSKPLLVAIADALHSLLSTFLDSADYVTFLRTNRNISDSVEHMIDVYLKLGEKAARRPQCWAVVCRLIAVSPPLVTLCLRVSGSPSSTDLPLKRFIDALKKALASSSPSDQLINIAVSALWKLALCRSKAGDIPARQSLCRLFNPVSEELQTMLFSRFQDLNADLREQFAIFLAAQYLENPDYTSKVIFETFLNKNPAEVHPQLALRALLLLSETLGESVVEHPDLLKLAPCLRRLMRGIHENIEVTKGTVRPASSQRKTIGGTPSAPIRELGSTLDSFGVLLDLTRAVPLLILDHSYERTDAPSGSQTANTPQTRRSASSTPSAPMNASPVTSAPPASPRIVSRRPTTEPKGPVSSSPAEGSLLQQSAISTSSIPAAISSSPDISEASESAATSPIFGIMRPPPSPSSSSTGFSPSMKAFARARSTTSDFEKASAELKKLFGMFITTTAAYERFLDPCIAMFESLYARPVIERLWPGSDRGHSFWTLSTHMLTCLSQEFLSRTSITGPLLRLGECLLRARMNYINNFKPDLRRNFGSPEDAETRFLLTAAFLCGLASSDPEVLRTSLRGLKELIAILMSADDILGRAWFEPSRKVFIGLATVLDRFVEPEDMRRECLHLLRRLPKFTPSLRKAYAFLTKAWNSVYEAHIEPILKLQDTLSPTHQASMGPDWAGITAFVCVTGGRDDQEYASWSDTSSKTNGANVADGASFEFPVFLRRCIEILRAPVCTLTTSLAVKIGDIFSQDFGVTRFLKLFTEASAILSETIALNRFLISKDRGTVFIERVLKIFCNNLLLATPDELVSCGSSLVVSPWLLLPCDFLHALSAESEGCLTARAAYCEFIAVVIQKRDYLNFVGEMSVRNHVIAKVKDWIRIPQDGFSAILSQRQLVLDSVALAALSVLMRDLPLIPPESTATDRDDVQAEMFHGYFVFLLHLSNGFADLSGTATENVAKSVFGQHDPHDQNFLPLLTRVKARGYSNDSDRAQAERGSRLIIELDRTSASTFPLSTAHCEQLLRSCQECACLAFFSLLSANLQCGFEIALPAAYHGNSFIRQIFAEVLTKTARKHSDFSEVRREAIVDERCSKLIELLTDPTLLIIEVLNGMLTGEDMDELAGLLFPLFESSAALYPLFFRAIEWETENSKSATTMFRRASLSTKLWNLGVQRYATSYLREILGPAVQAVATYPEGLEIDPAKNTDMNAVANNLSILTTLISECYTRIIESSSMFPEELRLFCHGIYTVIHTKYPEFCTALIGSFFFLRCITPALVSPHLYGVVHEVPSLVSMRSLSSFSKVLQAISNGQDIAGSHETVLRSFTSFISERFASCQDFIQKLCDPAKVHLNPQQTMAFTRFSSVDTSAATSAVTVFKSKKPSILTTLRGRSNSAGAMNAPPPPLPRPAILEEILPETIPASTTVSVDPSTAPIDLTPVLEVPQGLEDSQIINETGPKLHALVVRHYDNFYQALLTRRFKRDKQTVNVMETFDKLTRLLVQLGEPEPDTSELDSSSVSDTVHGVPTRKMSSFPLAVASAPVPPRTILERFEKRRVFYNAGQTKGGCHVVFHESALLSPADYDAYTYFAHSILSSITNEKLILVLNYTHFQSKNSANARLLKPFISLFSTHFTGRLSVIMFNPSSDFKDYYKTNAKTYERLFGPFFNRITQSTNDLEALKALVEPVQLPPSYRVLEKAHEFQNVTIITPQKESRVVNVSVGQHCLQFASLTMFKFYHTPSFVNDVLPFSQIKSVQQKEDRLLLSVLTLDDVKPTESVLTVMHPSLLLTDVICNIHQQHQILAPTQAVPVPVRNIKRPETVPGILLHISCFNFLAEQAALRSAAYRLMIAVIDEFELEVQIPHFDAQSLAVPRSMSVYVANLCKTLAAAQPGLCVEFLEQVVLSFRVASGHQRQGMLAYAIPWIRKLADPSNNGDTFGLLDKLVEMTMAHSDIFPLIQQRIWSELPSAHLRTYVLQRLLAVSFETQLTTKAQQVLVDVAVVLARSSPGPIPRKLLEELLVRIERSDGQVVAAFDSRPEWNEIEILAGFLSFVSFNNVEHILESVPFLFGIVLALVGNGSPIFAQSLFGLLLNCLHSVLELVPQDMPEVRGSLKVRMEELNSDRFLAIFRAKNTLKPFGDRGSADSLAMAELNALIMLLWEILLICEPLHQQWLGRFAHVTYNFAVNANTAIQPRAITSLGVILSEVPEDAPVQLLTIMADAIVCSNSALILAILNCFQNFAQKKGTTLEHAVTYIWASLLLLTLNTPQYTAGVLKLMEFSIAFLTLSTNVLSHHTLSHVALQLIQHPPQVNLLIDRLQRAIGVRFETNFSMAVGLLLIRSLTGADTALAEHTTRILLTLIEVERKATELMWPSEIAGYVAALLPFSTELQQELRTTSRTTDQEEDSAITSSTVGMQTDDDVEQQTFATDFDWRKFAAMLPSVEQQCLFLALQCSYAEHLTNERTVAKVLLFLFEAAKVFPRAIARLRSLITAGLPNLLSKGFHAKTSYLLHRLLAVVERASEEGAEKIGAGTDSCGRLGFSGIRLAASSRSIKEEDEAAISGAFKSVLEALGDALFSGQAAEVLRPLDPAPQLVDELDEASQGDAFELEIEV
eukprot:m.914006 g.914006  ORF g.914006 m.914006 type:complete len:2798 (+) comp60137_c0_seq2:82-8475(+)